MTLRAAGGFYYKRVGADEMGKGSASPPRKEIGGTFSRFKNAQYPVDTADLKAYSSTSGVFWKRSKGARGLGKTLRGAKRSIVDLGVLFLNITGVLKAESSFEFRSIFVIVDIIGVL